MKASSPSRVAPSGPARGRHPGDSQQCDAPRPLEPGGRGLRQGRRDADLGCQVACPPRRPGWRGRPRPGRSRTSRRDRSAPASRAPGPTSPGGTAGASPRTRATGTPAALPLTRSAAAATSSATRALGHAQRPPVGVEAAAQVVHHGAAPAAPSAKSVWPTRHGRPRGVAEHHGDRAARQPAAAIASRSVAGLGVRVRAAAGARRRPAPVFEASTPGRGHHRPGDRLDDPGDPARGVAARPRPARVWPQRRPRRGRAAGAVRPSALETTLLETTSTSPSRSAHPVADTASSDQRRRGRRPARTSGMPSRG